jgi:hypothetical protein
VDDHDVTNWLFRRLKLKFLLLGVFVTIGVVGAVISAVPKIWKHFNMPTRIELEHAAFGDVDGATIVREPGMSMALPAGLDLTVPKWIEIGDFAKGRRYQDETKSGVTVTVWALDIRSQEMERGTTSERLRRFSREIGVPEHGCHEEDWSRDGYPGLEITCGAEARMRPTFVKVVEFGWHMFAVAGEAGDANALEEVRKRVEVVLFDPETPFG